MIKRKKNILPANSSSLFYCDGSRVERNPPEERWNDTNSFFIGPPEIPKRLTAEETGGLSFSMRWYEGLHLATIHAFEYTDDFNGDWKTVVKVFAYVDGTGGKDAASDKAQVKAAWATMLLLQLSDGRLVLWGHAAGEVVTDSEQANFVGAE